MPVRWWPESWDRSATSSTSGATRSTSQRGWPGKDARVRSHSPRTSGTKSAASLMPIRWASWKSRARGAFPCSRCAPLKHEASDWNLRRLIAASLHAANKAKKRSLTPVVRAVDSRGTRYSFSTLSGGRLPVDCLYDVGRRETRRHVEGIRHAIDASSDVDLITFPIKAQFVSFAKIDKH